MLRKHYVVCQCFPVCHASQETLLRKQNLLPGKQKCFPTNSETFFVAETMFPSLYTYFQMFLARKISFFRIHRIQYFKIRAS